MNESSPEAPSLASSVVHPRNSAHLRPRTSILLTLSCLIPNCGHIGIDPLENPSASGGADGSGGLGSGGLSNVAGGASGSGASSPSGGRTWSGGESSGGKAASGGQGNLAGGHPGLGGAMGGEWGFGGAWSSSPCSEGEFGPLQLITGLAVERDKWAPSVTADGLMLTFSGSDSSSEAIYQATRPSRDAPFGEAIRLQNLEHTSRQGTPFINADGLRLYYSIEGDGGPSGRDLWFATRDRREDQFGTRRPLDTLNSGTRDDLPWLSFDEKTIFFTTSRNTESWLSEIWTATRATVDDDNFSSPSVVPTDRVDSEDGSPSLTPDGLTMYFTSDRSGEFDVWSVRRTSLSAPFADAKREAALSAQGEEISISLSPDGREMFLSSTGDSRQELFVSKRDCPD